MRLMLLLKAIDPAPSQDAPGHTDLMVTPETVDDFLDANPPPDAPDPEAMSQIPASDDAENWDTRLGLSDRLEEARRFADLGKSMRMVDPERPHEAHLVGPDLADPSTWRHTLLVDDQPFTDQEFDRAEDAFLSALRSGAVPASDAGAGHERASTFDLDQPFEAHD